MAKFSRYDPRNKKNGKHKKHSENKDVRIRKVTSKSDKYYGTRFDKVIYDELDWNDTDKITS